jgi:glyoxylase-like metal-dependent hydrolase (beta-lactamase superfamily II)
MSRFVRLLAAVSLPAIASLPLAAQPAPLYEAYAIRYATLANFPVRGLVAGADSSRRMDIAAMIWLLKGLAGRTVLVDAGFYRDEFMKQWKPTDYTRPSDAVEAFGVSAASVTDIIVSHVHWDHADGIDLFPNAHIWIQRAEYEYYVGADGEVLHAGIARNDAAMFAKLKAAGRITLIEGDDQEPIPGIRVYTGGRHTYASQYAGVHTRAGTVVIASDNCYLYENLEKHAAIAQTFDAASNLAAQARMGTIAASPKLIVPGHDPAVFQRFPTVKPGVVRIDEGARSP